MNSLIFGVAKYSKLTAAIKATTHKNKDKNSFVKPLAKEEPLKPNKEIVADVANIDRSDFDLFVLRVHVLSSEDNAKKMVKKINEGGFPAFTEVFGSKKNLHAVYVGPFIKESDINQNIELIQKVSESQNGEISRWKL